MSNETSKQRRARRAKEAAKVNESLDRLYRRAFKLPSFTGKARFIDSIKAIQTKAFNLAFNLKTEQTDS